MGEVGGWGGAEGPRALGLKSWGIEGGGGHSVLGAARRACASGNAFTDARPTGCGPHVDGGQTPRGRVPGAARRAGNHPIRGDGVASARV